jgi:hypothetical protein
MTRKQVAISLLAYLNNFGQSYKCRNGHNFCAVRKNGVCIDQLIKEYPDMANMERHELNKEISG